MSPALIATLAVVLGGALAALQSPTNALLAAAFQSPVTAAFVSFFIGTLVLAVATTLTHTPPDWQSVRALPWYAWLGGAYGAWFVFSAAYGAPKIGVAALVVFFLLGQLTMSLVIDQFGLLGVPQKPISLERIAGVALVFAGAWLVRRG